MIIEKFNVFNLLRKKKNEMTFEEAVDLFKEFFEGIFKPIPIVRKKVTNFYTEVYIGFENINFVFTKELVNLQNGTFNNWLLKTTTKDAQPDLWEFFTKIMKMEYEHNGLSAGLFITKETTDLLPQIKSLYKRFKTTKRFDL